MVPAARRTGKQRRALRSLPERPRRRVLPLTQIHIPPRPARKQIRTDDRVPPPARVETPETARRLSLGTAGRTVSRPARTQHTYVGVTSPKTSADGRLGFARSHCVRQPLQPCYRRTGGLVESQELSSQKGPNIGACTVCTKDNRLSEQILVVWVSFVLLRSYTPSTLRPSATVCADVVIVLSIHSHRHNHIKIFAQRATQSAQQGKSLNPQIKYFLLS